MARRKYLKQSWQEILPLHLVTSLTCPKALLCRVSLVQANELIMVGLLKQLNNNWILKTLVKIVNN